MRINTEIGTMDTVCKSPVVIVWMGVQPPLNVVILATVEGVFEELLGNGEVRPQIRVPPSDVYDVNFSRLLTAATCGSWSDRNGWSKWKPLSYTKYSQSSACRFI
ncbi:hypothetical protein GCK32_020897 [Trichostrongylus colubriformis]|uniref:Uncharacterized protein n=1 Tax=Trichostrongylus colubriformis TaxID=6319 RepID=A0AAN8FC80_TRICO